MQSCCRGISSSFFSLSFRTFSSRGALGSRSRSFVPPGRSVRPHLDLPRRESAPGSGSDYFCIQLVETIRAIPDEKKKKEEKEEEVEEGEKPPFNPELARVAEQFRAHPRGSLYIYIYIPRAVLPVRLYIYTYIRIGYTSTTGSAREVCFKAEIDLARRESVRPAAPRVLFLSLSLSLFQRGL